MIGQTGEKSEFSIETIRKYATKNKRDSIKKEIPNYWKFKIVSLLK
jgi:hypothetical protein